MHEQRSLRDDSVYRQIVDNARVATGAIMVLLTRVDTGTGDIQPAFWSGPDSDSAQAGDGTPTLGIDLSSLHINVAGEPCCQVAAVYSTGTPLLATVEDATDGCPHALLLRSAGAVASIRYVFMCPLKVWGRVEGALSFFTRDKLAEENLRVCETFVRQAALTLENAVLCDVLQVQLDHVEQTRRRLAEADERLRREVSEILRSRVQSRLLVVWHRLGHCQLLLESDPEKAKALIEEARTLVDDLRRVEIRDASCRLHPSIVEMGLLPALRSLMASFEEYFQINAEVTTQLQEIDDPLDSAIPEVLRLTAYRVLDEALNNVRRHASASRVVLSVRIDDQSRLEMVVRDDGCGFDTSLVKPGLGLSILGCRVDQAGGSMRITSEPGRGTVLTTVFPLDGSRT